MKKSVILIGAFSLFFALGSPAEPAASGPTAKPAASGSRSPAGRAPAKKQGAAGAKPAAADAKSGSTDLFGGGQDEQKGPTEITATQEAQFDTKTRSGVFVGDVKVVDPQFTMTADRLTVHLNRDEEGGGLKDAEADGHVVIVHVNQPKPSPSPGQPPNPPKPAVAAGSPAAGAPPAPAQTQQPATSVGRGDKAVYLAKDGSVTLTGWPQVTQGGNTHVATGPDVRMILYRDGKMQTFGSTRTLIEDKSATNSNSHANGTN